MKKEIIESLQKECIWIVPDDLKDEYERLLIENSKEGAILFQKVTTLSLFYEMLLKKHQYYRYHKIARIDKVKAIFQLVEEGNYASLKVSNMKEVVDCINEMMDGAIDSLPELDHLPMFLQIKLEECYDLYIKYLNYLKENNFYDKNYDLEVTYDLPIYVAGFGKLTNSQKHFLDKFQVTYVDYDKGDHDFKLMSFVNLKEEVQYVLHDIVVKVNQGARLTDFMIYAGADNLEMLQVEAKKYHVPLNGKESLLDPIIQTIRMIQKYCILHDYEALLEIMHINNKSEMTWDYDQRYRQGRLTKIYLERLMNSLFECETMAQYSTTLIEVLDKCGLKLHPKMGEIRNYIASYDLDHQMKMDDYLNMIIAFFPNLVEETNSLNAVNVQSIKHISPSKKYTYIIGCNEEKFPAITKDKGLLLNEGKKAFGLNHLIDDIENEKNIIIQILKQANHVLLSYPIATNKGDTLLISSFIEDLKKIYDIKNSKAVIREIASIEAEEALLMENHDASLENIYNLIDHYIETKNQPESIQIDKERDLSVSEIETYNGCPFRYFLNYGMKVKKWKDTRMQRSDYGTLRHDILEKCANYINGNEQDADKIIEQMCQDKKEEVENSKVQAYFIDQIEKQMKLNVRVLRYQNSIGDFKINEHEVDVREDNHNYAIHGRFDRKDIYNGFARIIDYKSSNKQLDLNLARLGFNIQMLLYLSMLDELPAGVLYFNMAERVVKDAKLNKTDLKAFYKQYKMNGFVIGDEEVLHAMNRIDENDVLPYSFTKKGELTKNSNVMNEESLRILLDEIHQRIEEIVHGIFDEGSFKIEPAIGENDRIQHIVNPCKYCDYESICLKDIFYNTGREIKLVEGGEEDEA